MLSVIEDMVAPPKKKRKMDHVDTDTMTTTEGTKRKKNKVKELDAHTPNSVVSIEDADQRPPPKKQKKKKEIDRGSPTEEVQISTADPSGKGNVKSKTSRSKKPPANTTDISTQGQYSLPAQGLHVKDGEMHLIDIENSRISFPTDIYQMLTTDV